MKLLDMSIAFIWTMVIYLGCKTLDRLTGTCVYTTPQTFNMSETFRITLIIANITETFVKDLRFVLCSLDGAIDCMDQAEHEEP